MRIVIKPEQGVPLQAGSLNLRIAGFGAASAAVESIMQALRRVPAFHLAGLREIEYAPEDASGVAGGVLAAYVQRERCVRFYRLPAPAFFAHVLHHEVGHHVLALVVSSKLRSLWVNRIARRSAPASVYGLISVEEDFAESYARYLGPQASDPGFADKRQFLRELVFSGDPWTLKERQAF
jgi:hypothetical protein